MVTYTTEPNIFRISLEKGVKLKSFSLGSLVNWNKNSHFQANKYLCEITIRCDNFLLPQEWGFRKGNYFISEGIWYYSRKLLGINLKFKYEPDKNCFTYFPNILGRVPFIYNSFYPMGYEISNILIYQMLKMGYVVLRASAFKFRGKSILLISPGYNGKTTIIKKILEKHSEDSVFISEDVVFLSKDKVIGMPPDVSNFGRKSNKGFVLKSADMYLVSASPDYTVFYYSGDKDLCTPVSNISTFPAVDFFSYFTKSLATAIMYHEDSIDIAKMYSLYKDIVSSSKMYEITTKGFNSDRFISYLYEIIKK